jgi:quercetin dioxygenase-like cupin family protein
MLGNQHLWAGGAACAFGVALLLATATGARDAAQTPETAAMPLLSSGETIIGEQIVYPTASPAKVTAAVVTLAPGQETGWHTHGVPTFGYMIEGELEVDYGANGVHHYRTGMALLEAIGVPHNGRNVGTGPARILVVFMGADGLKTTEPARH